MASELENKQKGAQQAVCAATTRQDAQILLPVQSPVECEQEKLVAKKVSSLTVNTLTFQCTQWACVITAITSMVVAGLQQTAHMPDRD